MRKRTFAAVAGAAGGLGVAASLAASAGTGALPPPPTLSATTPVATATVAVLPSATTTVSATTPVATATVALPPVETVVSPVTTAVAPMTTTATSVAGAAGGSATSEPPFPASVPSSQPPAAAGAGAARAGTGTFAAAATPTGTQVRAAPTLRVRRQPGRADTRRLVLTLRRSRELTVLFRGPGDTCRVAGRLVVHGRRGTNVVPLNGRTRGGRLAAGVFRVEVLDTTGSALRVLGKLAVSLRYDARGLPHVRQVRYVPRDCSRGVAALLASSRPVAGERATGGPAPAAQPGRDAGPPAAADTPSDVNRSGDGGGLAALPNLVPGDAVGGLAAVLVIGLLVLSGGGFLVVAGSSAFRALRR